MNVIRKFRKNVVQKRWEATYKIGKSTEIRYFRTESEFDARQKAQEYAEEVDGKLTNFCMCSSDDSKEESNEEDEKPAV